jgi:hypothetical protein
MTRPVRDGPKENNMMRFKVFLYAPFALLACFSITPSAEAQQSPPGHMMFVKGEHALTGRHFQEAISDFTEALRQGDDGSPIYVERSAAYALLAQNQHDPLKTVTLALADIKKAQDEGIPANQANESEYYYAIGLICSDTHANDAQAEMEFTRAIRLAPPCTKAVYERGVLRYAMGKRALAIQDMKQAVLQDHLTNDGPNERLARQLLAEFQHGGSR